MNKKILGTNEDKRKNGEDSFKFSPGIKKIGKYGSWERNDYIESQNSRSRMIPKNLVYHVKHTVEVK